MKKFGVLNHKFMHFTGWLLVLAAANVSAHHPIEAKFDTANAATLTGVVTAVDWRNPHTHVFMNVTTGSVVENWAIELESPIILRLNGWSNSTVQPGDQLQVQGIQARNGTRQIWGETVTQMGTGRQVFTVTESRPAVALSPRPTPTWPDGSVALGSITGGTDGYWGFPSETVLVEDGVNVDMNNDGILTNLADASLVAPLQPWALGLYKNRQQRKLQDDPMFINCKAPGGVRQFQSNLGFQLLEDKENTRIFELIGSGNHNYKIIYMDGREQTGLVGGDDDNPLYYGRSLAHWEDKTLVLNTKGFNEDFWFTNGGLPHSDQLELEERFTRTNADTLQYQVTINDAGAYTRAWTASWDFQWVSGEDLPIHFCQNNRQ
ncbi:MAG: DUF6152 family protein [Pseudohongiellaceae bacterium]